MKASLFLLVTLVCGIFAHAEEKKVQLPPRKNLHVYLLMGQSNMAGRGKIGEEDRTLHSRVLRLNYSNEWESAIEPIHQDRKWGLGVGSGFTFGKLMAEKNPNVTIALVPCAVGGTPLIRWSKGGDLYSNALARARIAMKDGTLKGILWHQGENDSIKLETAETYGDRLIQMITDFRRDLGAPNMPFVAGEIGHFLYNRKDTNATPHARMINKALSEMPYHVRNMACWTAEGLTHHGDEVHFDTKSQHEMGQRYAKKMIVLQKNTEPASRR